MKLTSILPLAALTTAFVIPDQQVMSEVAVETHRTSNPVFDQLPTKDQLISEFENTFSKVLQNSKNALDSAIESATETGRRISHKIEDTTFDTQSWLESEANSIDGGHGHHGDHEHHGHKGHHHKPNMTVYQLIAESKYTTKLASLINEHEDLVTLLNGTAANYTVFAPTDKAFEKIPEHAPKPSKEDLKKVLLYHVSADFYPAGRVLVTHTIPTALVGENLAGGMQRLSTNIGLRGLTVNFYSRIIAINIVRFTRAWTQSVS